VKQVGYQRVEPNAGQTLTSSCDDGSQVDHGVLFYFIHLLYIRVSSSAPRLYG
jgi:hypothetical protein